MPERNEIEQRIYEFSKEHHIEVSKYATELIVGLIQNLENDPPSQWKDMEMGVDPKRLEQIYLDSLQELLLGVSHDINPRNLRWSGHRNLPPWLLDPFRKPRHLTRIGYYDVIRYTGKYFKGLCPFND